MRVERPTVQRGPAPVRPRRVGHDHMRMQLGIPGATDPMDVLDGHEPLPHQSRRPTRTAPRPARVGLQIAKHGADSGAMRRQRLCGYPGIARGVENRDRLGRAVGHIPARDPDRPRPQHLAAGWVAPLKQRPQLTTRSGALQSQSLGAAAGPLPRRLASHRVVVLGAAGDLALVVVLVAGSELAQAHHDGLWKIAHTHRFNVRDGQLPHRTCQCNRVPENLGSRSDACGLVDWQANSTTGLWKADQSVVET